MKISAFQPMWLHKMPGKLKELQGLFMDVAEKYHVLPIDDRLLIRTDAKAVGRPDLMGERTSVTLGEGMKGMAPGYFYQHKKYIVHYDSRCGCICKW